MKNLLLIGLMLICSMANAVYIMPQSEETLDSVVLEGNHLIVYRSYTPPYNNCHLAVYSADVNGNPVSYTPKTIKYRDIYGIKDGKIVLLRTETQVTKYRTETKEVQEEYTEWELKK